MNKKIILLVLILCISIIFVGCGDKKSKIPEGIGEDFYSDMVFSHNDLIKNIKTIKDKDGKITYKDNELIMNSTGRRIIDEYYEKIDKLNETEVLIVTHLRNIYLSISDYYDFMVLGIEETWVEDDIKKDLEKYVDLMDLKIPLKSVNPTK